MPHQVPWLILLFPLLSLLIIAFILRPFFNSRPKLGGYVTIAAIGISCALSFWVLSAVMAAPHHELELPNIHWLLIGDLSISVGLMVNSLTAIMLIVVTIVSLMVQIYSVGYMHNKEDLPSLHRYYAELSLFVGSMMGLVIANNFLLMFIFWELVGLGTNCNPWITPLRRTDAWRPLRFFRFRLLHG